MHKSRTVVYRCSEETVVFAAMELRKYLRMMMPNSGYVDLTSDVSEEGLHVGLFTDFGLTIEGDPKFDDMIHIEVKNKTGIIAGSNPRSVLLAVYRYLYKNGCRWPRPGAEGELIPEKECGDVSYRHTASNRYRGMCIEGAVTYQNMLENIEWAPKVGFSTYMLEYSPPYLYFNNWYDHKNNNYTPSERVSLEDVTQRCAWLETEIKKRGMDYHAAGHGWTSIPMGLNGCCQIPETKELPEEITQYMAMIDGKRGLFRDSVAVHTNLCYSNPAARRKMVVSIADYAERNGQIDYLHVWLADNDNNYCECENCRDTIVSDFYVMILNELDEELTARNNDMKIVFIAYNELIWPPKTQAFKNQDRFSMLFAPSMRSYTQPYTAEPYDGVVPELVLNDATYTKSTAGNLEFLRGWKKVFQGESFCYEYYFWRDHCLDLGYYDIAKVIYEDIQCLKKLKLDGIISDQVQRSFMPTGFPMYVLAQTLYDTNCTFEELAEDFFATFGEDGKACQEYMSELSRLFDPAYLRGPEDRQKRRHKPHEFFINEEAANKLRMVRPLVDKFRPLIRKNMQNGCRCIGKSWKYLEFHAELCERMADVYLKRAEGYVSEAKDLWRRTHTWLSMHENDVQDAFDLYLYVYSVERFIDLEGTWLV